MALSTASVATETQLGYARTKARPMLLSFDSSGHRYRCRRFDHWIKEPTMLISTAVGREEAR